MSAETSLLAELVEAEQSLHRAARLSREEFEALTAPDFREIGASGHGYDREQVWRALEQERRAGEPRSVLSVEEPCSRRLGPHTYLLTYRSAQGPRRAHRASIWERTSAGWRIVHHQGTLTAD